METPLGASIAGDYQRGVDGNNHGINVGGLGLGVGLQIRGVSGLLGDLGTNESGGNLGGNLRNIHGSASYTWVNGPFRW